MSPPPLQSNFLPAQHSRRSQMPCVGRKLERVARDLPSRRKKGRSCCGTPAFPGIPNAASRSELFASTLPSRRPKRGCNCYLTPTFSGVSRAKRAEKIRISYLTPTLARAQRGGGGLLHNPYFLGRPQHQARGENQNNLPHCSFLGGPKEGGLGMQPLHSQGSPTRAK